MKLGNQLDEDTDDGPMIDTASARRAKEWVDEAVNAGGRIAAGGNHQGTLFEPTVIIDPPTTVKASCEEIFAPVIVIHRVENLEEAIRVANNSAYGLQAGIFTTDMNEAFEAARQLDDGSVIINDACFRSDLMSYGGVKRSWLGREGVRYVLEEMTEPKVVVFRLG